LRYQIIFNDIDAKLYSLGIEYHPDRMPWLETKRGNIYSQSKVNLDSPVDFYNATYVIKGDEIERATSQCADFASRTDDICGSIVSGNIPNWSQQLSFGQLFDFPATTPDFSSNLGRIDLKGIYAGQYGKVITIDNGDISGLNNLSGKVYRYTGDLNIPLGGLTINNDGGPGLIIVEGDLIIDGPIIYQGNLPANLKNLGSVAWLVRGSIKVNSTATELAGAFIALGAYSSGACPVVSSPEGLERGCGRFDSCFSGDDCGSSSLTVSGLVMARQFKLSRGGNTIDGGGSELIIYDGRVMANTPPGLGDLLKGLPNVWREVAPK
jgi:hypothetical protein